MRQQMLGKDWEVHTLSASNIAAAYVESSLPPLRSQLRRQIDIPDALFYFLRPLSLVALAPLFLMPVCLPTLLKTSCP